jgi:hypothetical protein
MASQRRSLAPRRRMGFWYLARCAPMEFAAVDKRQLVLLGTGVRVGMIRAVMRRARPSQSWTAICFAIGGN